MKVEPIYSINFKRRLKTGEEAEYTEVLNTAKEKASHGKGKNILIVPAMSLPQSKHNNTGVGNLAAKESEQFFDFAKKYWGINEVQILPMGHFFEKNGKYAIYSGTSTDLGNHVINLEDFVTKEELERIVKANTKKDIVNYSNVVLLDSVSEQVLKDVYKRMTPEMRKEFEQYKIEYDFILKPKSLYRALRELIGNYDYHQWSDIDKNLFNEDIVSIETRNRRIEEITKLKGESIEFYKFKNFLAEKSFQKGKEMLHSKGLKLDGDFICNFAFEEEWSCPKAFVPHKKLYKWDFPVLDVNSPYAERLLREKVNIYAKRYDNLRIDASWSYLAPAVKSHDPEWPDHIENGEKFLNIIEDEIKKVKGPDYDLKNIMYEFAADYKKEFNIYDGFSLKPEVEKRVRIYTSEYLSEDWGSADAFFKRGWEEDMFVLGMTSHDSGAVEYSEKQAKVLSRILKIPLKKLKDKKEFIKAKFAEPMRAKNNMLFFIHALGLKTEYIKTPDFKLNYTARIPENYEDFYFKALNEGFGFNPMDALEKQFIAQGLDKKEPELFNKIVKFRKILAEKEKTALWKKMVVGAVCLSILSAAIHYIYSYKNQSSSSKYVL